jgi:hypothetical protein
VPPDPDGEARPITVYDAAPLLDRAPSTLHVWAVRYGARKLGKQGRRVYYDFHDLAVIEREIRHGHVVPATPEERAAVRRRCPLVDWPHAAA